ncbi:hypothetical protein BDP27DRAFT_1311921 [Rhodocollybia butyracea]|uniref:Uncharacterized protein n=1 Tax=Rhodocollybia butyracea TaxID=206335 RepID=A0A9P5Q2H2_9AGAR|nr:hypothetical protein BDP27DRAFT_1311921 [Rhodocollybia butyracea]
MGRKHNKTEKKKRAAERDRANEEAANRRALERELLDQLQDLFQEAGRQRAYTNGPGPRSPGFGYRGDSHDINSRAWEAFVKDEVVLYTGNSEFQIIRYHCIGAVLLLVLEFLLFILDKTWMKVFQSQSHPNAVFSVLYIVCCVKTAVALGFHTWNAQMFSTIAAKGLPFLRASHSMYYHSHPSEHPPSVLRNPYHENPSAFRTVFAPFRIRVFKFLYNYSFPLLYAPFLVFWIRSRRYDAFPTRWWTIILALGIFWWISSSVNGVFKPLTHPHSCRQCGDLRASRANKEKEAFHSFWGGLGIDFCEHIF